MEEREVVVTFKNYPVALSDSEIKVADKAADSGK